MRLSQSFIICLITGSAFSFQTTFAHFDPDTNEHKEVAVPADLADFFNAADVFLSTYVSGGMVDYSAIAADKSKLSKLTTMIAEANLATADKDTKLAFYINSYNLLTIKNLIDSWPLKSPLDKKGFFDAVKFTIAGESLTLNDIENKKLRPDPRVHFVLVCGAKGCPTIMNSAYMPDKVQAQMDIQTKKALDNSNFIRIDEAGGKVLISEIFKWYADDFVKHSGSVEKYINTYRSKPLPSGLKIDYYTYDWQVNQKK
jgi:hypothetical protein